MAVSGQDDAKTKGQWEPVQYRNHNLPVHVALLHTGKVLTFGGSCNDRTYLPAPRPAELWDPGTGEARTIDQPLAGDIFCAGHCFLPDGRVLIAGGTTGYDTKRNLFGLEVPLPPFRGSNQSYVFDPVAELFTRGDDLAVGRWYPTLVMLGDGRVVAVAGLTGRFPWVVLRKTEIYSPGSGWQHMSGADRWLPLYPRLHLLPDGRVVYCGSYNTHYTFPFSLSQFPTSILNAETGRWEGLGLPNKSEREEGTTVLLPLAPPDYRPRILLAGGGTSTGTEAIPDAEIIDLSEPRPRWRQIDPMHHARYYVYPVILPDGRVLVLGGRSGTKGHEMHPGQQMPDMPDMPGMPGMPHDHPPGEVPHDPRAVLEAELFDPATEKWTPMAPMTVDRLYHSAAVLLPDGRVATFGNNPTQGVNERRIETYRPPYLFQGPRPRLEDVPASVPHGGELEIHSADASAIDSVVLIRPTVTTHCVNTEQRLVRLEYRLADAGRLVAAVPDSVDLLPPGYYMLFILTAGVPSVARMILVS